ncbi:PKD domain-containing protein [Crocinitomix catalasitica]|nr:PKD domain-containing protein [Crocinitomix catalasitica]MBN4077644.1 PKD domain-containing protein [bacterium AH-315-C20]
MKKLLLLFACTLFVSISAIAQEDCADGIDNDGDTFIDLNDPDCDCAGFGGDTISSLIPNPSFEDMSCCPTAVAMLTCADTWIQASTATSDYFNTCGIIAKPGMTPPLFPLPGGGNGYAGFYEQGSIEWQEYIGACLTSPMLGGTSYVLNLWIAWGDVGNVFDLAIFGTPDCTDLPWGSNVCPTAAGGSWELLDEAPLVVPFDGSWIEVTLTFTPTVDIYAVCIGSVCEPLPSTWDYFYVDELILLDSSSFSTTSDITESGNWCNGDLLLTYTTDTVTTGTLQWYQEGIALAGETGWTIDVMPYGPGTYQLVYTLGPNCAEAVYSLDIPDDPIADFNVDDVCEPDDVTFTDASTGGTGTIITWDWDFDDGGSSTIASPIHTYGSTGSYNVTLTVTTNQGCTGDTTITVNVNPKPVADFTFEMNGTSSDDGLTGGCITIPVDFIDGSIVAVPGTITGWSWNFGDGGTSTSASPTYTYGAPGSFTITLVVTTSDGCTHNYSLPILMTDELEATIIQNDPTCWGFSDGSFTVLVEGFTTSAVTFIFTDDASNVINIGGSNAANSLSTGWYYYDVSELGGCTAEGAIFIDQPEKMDVELSITNVQCFGDLTGSVSIDTVNYHQGDYSWNSYIWSSGPPGGLGITSVTGLGQGEYTLTLTDSLGCAIDTVFYITQPPPIEFAEIGYEPAYCRIYDYQIGNGQVYAAAFGGVPSYTYLWTALPAASPPDTSENTTWGGLNPGDYQMVVTDANGCTLTQVITLDSVNPTAILDLSSAQLNGANQGTAEVCIELMNTSIYFANPLNPIADTSFWLSMDYPKDPYVLYQDDDFWLTFDTCYTEGGQYNVCLKIQNKNGCEDSICHLITVWDPLVISPPNIFTPNGDGVNDEYTFEFLSEGVRTFNCVIVNRWGVTMAEINDIADGWDGTDKSGSSCRDGVYFFVYSGTAENGEPFEGQGTIQIVSAK